MVRILLQGKVAIEERFLSAEEVAHLLALAEPRWQPSTVVSNATGESELHPGRSGMLAHLPDSKDDPVLRAIEERIAVVTGTRPEQGEMVQVVKYGPGEQYEPHFDWFDPAVEGPRKCLADGGQRVISCILYLQTPEEGGETNFPAVPLSVKATSGDMLVFKNMTAPGVTDPQMLHGGAPVVKGQKIIATKWIRERAADGSEESAVRATLDAAEAKAKAASEEYKKAVQDAYNQRRDACFAEVEVVLRKFDCTLTMQPEVTFGEGGMMRMGGKIMVVPSRPRQVRQ